jgi:ubiquinone/menaquinone biosynthesis C-methylase UbiE
VSQPEREENRIREAYARRKQLVPSGRYSLANSGNLSIEQERERYLLHSLAKFGKVPLFDKRILDVGCGNGPLLFNLIRWGARPENISGMDLQEERIATARALLPSSVTLKSGSATRIDFNDHTFDLLFQSTVFSSIFDNAIRQQIANEMLRVLKPDGCIVWYDFHVNNPSNPDVRGVKKEEIKGLFPHCQFHFHRITLMPPAARVLGRLSFMLCEILSSLKVFTTHYQVIITKVSPSLMVVRSSKY